ncbi:hypothetical protein ES708_33202 [subsurface metagenome]
MPITVPPMLPTPPVILVPPITTAAIESNSAPRPISFDALPIRARSITAANPQQKPHIVYINNLCLFVLIAANFVASSLPPMA